jgi:hypothetical protein
MCIFYDVEFRVLDSHSRGWVRIPVERCIAEKGIALLYGHYFFGAITAGHGDPYPSFPDEIEPVSCFTLRKNDLTGPAFSNL